MEHQEELPFGCSICGSKFKSASTLSRHRESHAQVKKPIKKLKIKIIDGSCIISKVDSPAGAQRDRGSRDNSPAIAQVKAGNQGSAVTDGTADPHAAESVAQVSNNSVIDFSHSGQTVDKSQAGETYMVEISTVEDNILLPNQSDVIEDEALVPHPTDVITESTVPPTQPDVIEEPVIDTEGTLLISNEGGVVSFSESTNNEQTIQSADEYLTPVSEAQPWTEIVPIKTLSNQETEIPVVQNIQDTVQASETPAAEAHENVVVQSEVPEAGAAVITEQITEATIAGGAHDITQLSALPPEETVQETYTVEEEVPSTVIAPDVTPITAPETNIVRESVIEIAPTVVKVGEDIQHVVDAPKVSEAVLTGGINHEISAEQTGVQVSAETCENGEVDEAKSIVTSSR